MRRNVARLLVLLVVVVLCIGYLWIASEAPKDEPAGPSAAPTAEGPKKVATGCILDGLRYSEGALVETKNAKLRCRKGKWEKEN